MAPGSPKIEELRARLQADPKSRMFLPLAEELRKAGQLEEAERVLNQGIAAHPSYLSAWVSLGRVLLARGNPTGAADAANRALKIDPENIVAARVCADAYLAAGNKVEAIKKYKLVHAFLPTDLEIQAHIEELDRSLNPELHMRPIAVSEDSGAEFNVLEETPPEPEEPDLGETRAMPQVALPWEEAAPQRSLEPEPAPAARPEIESAPNDVAEEARTFLEAALAQPAVDEDEEDTLSRRTPSATSSDLGTPPMAGGAWSPVQEPSDEDTIGEPFEELPNASGYTPELIESPVEAPPEWEALPPVDATMPAIEEPAEILPEQADEREPVAEAVEPAPLMDGAALAETQYIQPVPEPDTGNRATIARLEGWLRAIRKVDE